MGMRTLEDDWGAASYDCPICYQTYNLVRITTTVSGIPRRIEDDESSEEEDGTTHGNSGHASDSSGTACFRNSRSEGILTPEQFEQIRREFSHSYGNGYDVPRSMLRYDEQSRYERLRNTYARRRVQNYLQLRNTSFVSGAYSDSGSYSFSSTEEGFNSRYSFSPQSTQGSQAFCGYLQSEQASNSSRSTSPSKHARHTLSCCTQPICSGCLRRVDKCPYCRTGLGATGQFSFYPLALRAPPNSLRPAPSFSQQSTASLNGLPGTVARVGIGSTVAGALALDAVTPPETGASLSATVITGVVGAISQGSLVAAGQLKVWGSSLVMLLGSPATQLMGGLGVVFAGGVLAHSCFEFSRKAEREALIQAVASRPLWCTRNGDWQAALQCAETLVRRAINQGAAWRRSSEGLKLIQDVRMACVDCERVKAANWYFSQKGDKLSDAAFSSKASILAGQVCFAVWLWFASPEAASIAEGAPLPSALPSLPVPPRCRQLLIRGLALRHWWQPEVLKEASPSSSSSDAQLGESINQLSMASSQSFAGDVVKEKQGWPVESHLNRQDSSARLLRREASSVRLGRLTIDEAASDSDTSKEQDEQLAQCIEQLTHHKHDVVSRGQSLLQALDFLSQSEIQGSYGNEDRKASHECDLCNNAMRVLDNGCESAKVALEMLEARDLGTFAFLDPWSHPAFEKLAGFA